MKNLKTRVRIGAIAIFICSCVELWNVTTVSKLGIIVMSFFVSAIVSIGGYLFMKWFAKKSRK